MAVQLRQLTDIKETWTQACKDYGLSEAMKVAMLDQWGEIELRTWRRMFPDQGAIKTWVQGVTDIGDTNVLVQSAKLGRMLHEYKAQMESLVGLNCKCAQRCVI